MKQARFLTAAAIVAALAACGTPNPNARPVKSPVEVVLTEDDITDRPYVVIEDIEVTVSKPNIFADDPTRADVAGELRKKAAQLGADAVVLARYGTVGMGVFTWGKMSGRGRAVVFK